MGRGSQDVIDSTCLEIRMEMKPIRSRQRRCLWFLNGHEDENEEEDEKGSSKDVGGRLTKEQLP